MLKDITLGQFYPGESCVHKLDPRVKIILTGGLIAAVFVAGNLLGFIPIFLFIVLAARLAKLPFLLLARGVKPLRIVLAFTFLLNLFFGAGETPLLDLGFTVVTTEALISAIRFSLRLVLLVLGTSMLTLTTSPVTLTDGLERLMSPLRVIKFPAHEMAMMMTIALRFIPTLVEEADKIMKAQMARGADFESGNLLARAKAMVPLLVPLFVSAFRRASELALAMEARCYHGGEGRTRLRVLKIEGRDIAALAVMAALITLVAFMNQW